MKIITPIVEIRTSRSSPRSRQFLGDLWDTIGAPIWEWIKQYAADQWQAVKDVAVHDAGRRRVDLGQDRDDPRPVAERRGHG